MARNPDALVFGEALMFFDAYVGDGSETIPDPDPGGDDVQYGDEWGGTWQEVGYTQDGISFTINMDREPIEVDQELDALFLVVTGREIEFNTNMAEFSMDNLEFATGQGTVTTTAAGAGTHGYTTYEIAGYQADKYYVVGVDILQPSNSLPMRVAAWKGLPVGSVDASFGDRASNAQIPLGIRALPDAGGGTINPPRVIEIVQYNAAPTS